MAHPRVDTQSLPPDSRLTRIVKKFGVLGFLFFLIKGLLWLAVPAAIAWWGQQ